MIMLDNSVIANRNIGVVYNDDLRVCEPHTHTFFELAYIIGGSAVHTIDGISTSVSAGDYLFIEPGHTHFLKKVITITSLLS